MIALPPSEEGVLQLIVLQDPGSGAPREDTPVGGAGTVAAGGLGVGDGTAGVAAEGGATARGGGAVAHSTTHRCSSPDPEVAAATASDTVRSEHVAAALRNRDVHCSREVCRHGNVRI